MANSTTKCTEMKLVSGSVAYRCEKEEPKVNEEEHTFMVDFNSLEELIVLLSTEKLKMYSIHHEATVIVESVGFIAQSDDNKSRVETVLMEDDNYIELLQH